MRINSPKPFYSRELKVLHFTAQEKEEAEWPEAACYNGKGKGGVEEVSLSLNLSHEPR